MKNTVFRRLSLLKYKENGTLAEEMQQGNI